MPFRCAGLRRSACSNTARTLPEAMGATKRICGLRCAIHAAARMKSAPEPLDFAQAAAGQQRDDGRALFQPSARRAADAIDLQRNLIGQRMADERRLHAVPRIELRLEGQQAQHQVNRLADGPHPPLPPGPHLRTHVLNRTQAFVLQLLCQPEIELRSIDADEHVRPVAREICRTSWLRSRSSRGR